MALTKAEMAEALFNQLGLNKREARELVDLFFEEVRAALSGGEQVKLSGFGNFDLRDKNQRPGQSRSEEHTSELQSRLHLVCRLLLEKKKTVHHAISSRRSVTADGPCQPRN